MVAYLTISATVTIQLEILMSLHLGCVQVDEEVSKQRVAENSEEYNEHLLIIGE